MDVNIENLMKTAVEEMKNGQHAEASKHFDMVVINDASNIDAPFFRAYCNCYDIKLGEMSNAAIGFTNAFCRYVDAVKALNDPTIEKEKMNYAVILLTELVSMYKLNAKNQMFTTPSIGITISTAATNMNQNCRNKLINANVNVSAEIMAANEANNQANNKTGLILAALVVIGAIIFVLWMIPWYMF